MTIKNIIYLISTNPITFLDTPSAETKEFEAKIIISPAFNAFTKTIRKLYGYLRRIRYQALYTRIES